MYYRCNLYTMVLTERNPEYYVLIDEIEIKEYKNNF